VYISLRSEITLGTEKKKCISVELFVIKHSEKTEFKKAYYRRWCNHVAYTRIMCVPNARVESCNDLEYDVFLVTKCNDMSWSCEPH
jgi:hypothetical protein